MRQQNDMVAICSDDELILIINGVQVGKASDTQLSSGEIALGVVTLGYPNAEVVIHELEVSIP